MADFVRIYTGDDGFTHFEDRYHQYGDPAAHGAPVASGVSAVSASAGTVDGATFRKVALGNSSRHAAPRKQYAVILTGSLIIQTGDGEERKFVPGQVLLIEDTKGEGHLSTFSSDEPCTFMTVHLSE